MQVLPSNLSVPDTPGFLPEVLVAAIARVGTRPCTHPCGVDCRYAARLNDPLHEEWLRCAHPALGGVVREGRECASFETSP